MKFFELKLRLIAPVVLLCCFVFFRSQSAHATCNLVSGGSGVGATDTNTVLMLATTLTDNFGSSTGNLCTSVEAVQANALGFNVEIDDAAAWGAKSTAQFASYRAIVLGDPDCFGPGTGPITEAESTTGTWGPAITGRVAIVGTDPEDHSLSIHNSPPQSTTAIQLTENAIAYATSLSGQPGAYISLSCYYFTSAPNTPVPVLAPFGSFTVQGQGACPNTSSIVATTNALVNSPNVLTNAGLSNWTCSTHEAFNSYTSNFTTVVQSVDLGLPYILTGTAGGESQTKTLGPPGTTTTYTFNTDSYKITPTDNSGGESLTITAFLIPKNAFPSFTVINNITGSTNTETCVPYGDYSSQSGVDTCVEFQATCTTTMNTTCNFDYVLATGYDLPSDLPAIGGPDFLAAHGVNCPLTSTSTVVSIFEDYEVSIKDPTTIGGSEGPTCYAATYTPSAAPITTGVGFVGWESPVSDTELNLVKAGSTVPLKFQFFDNLGNPVLNLAYCNTVSSTPAVCSDPAMAATPTTPWINLNPVVITCQNSSAINTATDTSLSLVSNTGLLNQGGGNYQLNWKTPKGQQGCANIQVTYSTGGAANVVLFPASFGFLFD